MPIGDITPSSSINSTATEPTVVERMHRLAGGQTKKEKSPGERAVRTRAQPTANLSSRACDRRCELRLLRFSGSRRWSFEKREPWAVLNAVLLRRFDAQCLGERGELVALLLHAGAPSPETAHHVMPSRPLR